MNFGDLETNGAAASNDTGPSRPRPAKPAPAPEANSTANTTANAE